MNFSKSQSIISALLGPVVQSIVSLTKSLLKDLLSFLAHIKSSVLINLLNIYDELLHTTSQICRTGHEDVPQQE